jgi:glycolate oxidase iron-sulfur subunit
MNQPPAYPSLSSPEFQNMLQQCIHCGLCLQACPTYTVFGAEMDAPRGRIALMRAASQGRINTNGAFQEHIDLCLACRACETACPSGVRYGFLVEQARLAIDQARPHSRLENFVRWLALRQLMPYTGRLRWLARSLRLYQLSGLQRLVRALDLLPGRLKLMERLLPRLPSHYPDYRRTALAFGQKRGAVAFFHGCLQDAFLGNVNRATIRVLQRNGYEVHFPPQQTCCGAAHQHTGEVELARQLARKNIDAFLDWDYVEKKKGGSPETEKTEIIAIINNAGGCGAALKEYPELLKDDPQYAAKARQFAAQVMDISEFLAEHLNEPPQGEVRLRATYSDSCHLRHVQQIVRQPRDLLAAIPGLELVELAHPEHCCGSAGVYNLVQIEAAQAILDAKMADIRQTGAQVVVTTNPGCQFQLINGAQGSETPLHVVHLVELLEQSYRREQNGNPKE